MKTCWNLIRAMGISADEIFYPETTAKDSSIEQIARLAATCTPEQRTFIIGMIRLMTKQEASASDSLPEEFHSNDKT